MSWLINKIYLQNSLLLDKQSQKNSITNFSFLFGPSTLIISYHMLDPVFSPSTELAGFRMVIVFTISRHFVRSHASSFPSPFFFISFSTCFFHVCFGLPLPVLQLTSNFKAFTITFSSSFLKT